MEIKIVINSRNKDQVLSLVNQLVQAEAIALGKPDSVQEVLTTPGQPTLVGTKGHDLFDSCQAKADFALTPGVVAERPIGAWAMFNSFLPGKATLRVMGHLLRDKKAPTVTFGELIDESVRSVKMRGLSGMRGFPGSRKASAIPRYANHLVLPFAEMGLISSQNHDRAHSVGVTEAGVQFSLLKNPVLDGQMKETQFSDEERKWLIEYLKKIDDMGFKEYTTLKLMAEFIRGRQPSRETLVEWFSNKLEFREFIKSRSKYANEPGKLRKQLSNLANTYVSSKIALLRELGTLSDRRGVYSLESTL